MRRRLLLGLLLFALLVGIAVWHWLSARRFPFTHIWLRVPDHFDPLENIYITDLDGDGNDDLICQQSLWLPSLSRRKDQEPNWWVTMKAGQLTVKPLPLRDAKVKGRWMVGTPGGRLEWLQLGSRLWFAKVTRKTHRVGPKWHYLRSHSIIVTVTEIGIFRPDGQWQPVVRIDGKLLAWDDLDGDGTPECLVRKSGGDAFEPIEPNRLWRQLPDGRWQGYELPLPTKWRRIFSGLLGELIPSRPQMTHYFVRAQVVRWDGKKWFLTLWHDGLQAVTVSQR